MLKSKILISSFLILILVGIFLADFSRAQENYICVVYITGIGCPNCAITDPVVLSEWTEKYPNLVVIEYEIYKNREANYDTTSKYFENYATPPYGIPFLILNKENIFVGRFDVLEAEDKIATLIENECPLPGGGSQKFEDLDPNNLPGKPSIVKQTEPEKGLAAISETVKNNQESSFNFLYLLISIAVFVFILLVLYSKKRKHESNQ